MDQLQNLVLNLMQQRRMRGQHVFCNPRHEDIQLKIKAAVTPRQRTLEFIQADDEVTSLSAKACQQRIGLEVQFFICQPDQRWRLGMACTLLGDALVVRVGAQTAAYRLTIRDDIAPVMATGIGDHQIDVHHPRQRMECIQRLARQRRNTEHEQPRWQGVAARRGQCLERSRRCHETTMQRGTVMLATALRGISQHCSP